MSIQFKGVDHIGIAVADIDAASHTYGKMLGLPESGRETLPERGIEVRFFETGDGRVELLGAINERSEISGFLEKRGPGIHHICLRVDNLESAVQQIKAEGGRILGDIQAGAHGTRVAFVHPKDCHGVLIELVEAKNAA